MSDGAPQAPRERLLALDAFRGATIAAMILVNNPGTWSAIYPPLEHAAWHGWTPTDLIFPFFLWIVGVAITLSLGRRAEAGAARGPLLRKIAVRTLWLVGLGLFLSALGGVLPALLGLGARSLGDAFAHWRFPGVLQRIGVCYAVTATAFLLLPRRALPWLCGALLVGYHLLLTQVPVPGHAAPDLDDKAGTIASWVDLQVFGPGHIWLQARVYDPEGLLSTLPAIGTCLFGVFAGGLVRSTAALEQRVLRLFVHGSLLVVLGYVWSLALPINKALWTSSYAALTAGQAACALALCLYACDVRGIRRWAAPLRIYGVNPITVFVGSGVLARVLGWIDVGTRGGRTVTARSWLYDEVWAAWLGPGELASLAYALTWVLGWLAVLWVMDRRGIHLKI
ncbi:MAG: DUF5009 domain-containing protein [Planctomycetes bacterium]|nr:DUF5009 domain-containing protein [Planctomycetota bacterium]